MKIDFNTTVRVKTSIIQDAIKKVDEMDRLELIEYISLLLNHIEELEGVIDE
jgi:hypothetical protein|tara:strand:- start:1627 stop:1782 length:156 start_codon:yes stop_codon:yes gene_type:complete